MNQNKIILDLCGGTGAWGEPYRKAGYDYRLITLPQYNVFNYDPPADVYGILAAPMCTHFSLVRTSAKTPRDLKKGMALVTRCLEIIWQCNYELPNKNSKITKLKFWAMENPNGFLKYFLGKPALEFNPFDYGDRYQKRTHLWGWFNEPKKSPIELTVAEKIKFTGNGQRLPALKERNLFCPDGYEFTGRVEQDKRGVCRSITPAGFAKAFFEANQ